mmetsp:Transcript_16710/g.25243  ORF Transcript_16710/g.25243 Transcript_16710/m.25243 type:complete len:276 (+) Transcript_16710:52-879(+)
MPIDPTMKMTNLVFLAALFVFTPRAFCTAQLLSSYLGELHNKILDDFSNADFPGLCKPGDADSKVKCETDVDIVVEEVVGYITKEHVPIITTDFVSEVIPKTLKYIEDFENFQDLGDAISARLLEDKKISDTDASFMQTYLANLNELSEIATDPKKNQQQKEQIAKLLQKAEKEVASALAKGAVIMAITVQLNSFEYWIAVENDETNPWYDINEERKADEGGTGLVKARRRRLHWFIRDGMGACGGFIVGFLVGGFIGGGIGAVGGGAAASLIGK